MSIIFLYIYNFFVFGFRNPSLLQGYRDYKKFPSQNFEVLLSIFRFLISINFY